MALPAIASFCGTLLVHFRLRENWELRELGRIDVDEAVVKASFLPTDDPDQFTKQFYELQMARVRLARPQTARFFATISEKQAEQSPDKASQEP